jgi:hypothetical protein
MARTRDEAARGRVLSSARDLVWRLGPRAVTVDEIAAAGCIVHSHARDQTKDGTERHGDGEEIMTGCGHVGHRS